MESLRLARHAMATRFELVLYGENPVSLRAAGEEALDEIDRLEAQLSLFKPASEIARINARAAYEPVRVTPPVFQLLDHARRINEETGGAFDLTIAALMRCWGFLGGSGHMPNPTELAAARQCVGMRLVHLDAVNYTVCFERPGVMIDLGAIGKGYAIDRAVELLRDAGVEGALIHGGTSTVYAMGHPPDADSWKIEIPSPDTIQACDATLKRAGEALSEQVPPQPVESPFATVCLSDASLSVSAVWGKFFKTGGQSFGHIIDPGSGQPADRAILSTVVLPSATETDALSTALLTVGPSGHDQIASLRPGMKTLVVGPRNNGFEVRAKDIEFQQLT